MTLALRNIVCGVDFSSASEAALDTVIMLARDEGATVHAVHAYTMPVVPLLESGIVAVDEDRLVASIEADLRALVATHHHEKVVVECRAAAGWPADALLREAHAAHAELVAVGTRGLSGLPRFLLGGIAERIARISPVPVLVVPERSAGAAPRPIRTVLCAMDFSAPSRAALSAACALSERRGAALRLVHIWSPPSVLSSHPELAAGHERELQRELEEVAAGAGAHVAGHRIRRGTPYDEIVAEARDIGADLIVLGSTGRSGPAHFLLGSTVERVLRTVEIPALVVREGRAGGH